jgi:hypothetical protein
MPACRKSFIFIVAMLLMPAAFAQDASKPEAETPPSANDIAPVTEEPKATPQSEPKATPQQEAKIPVQPDTKTPAPQDAQSPSQTVAVPATAPPAASGYTDPANGDSRPFFDWSQHKGETLVKHPLAEKGLIEITKDKTYIYTVPEGKGTHAATFHVGIFNPVNLKNPDGDANATFADNYGQSSSPAIFIDYEWTLFKLPIGKLSLTAGSGVFVAQGHGHFTHPELNPGLTPKENFTFAAFPTSTGLTYRLQFYDKQLIVPYGSGGGTLIPFTELRDDNQGPKFGGALAAFAAVGGALNLTSFDKLSAIALDREYGVTRVWLNGEFREMIALSRYDFGGGLINFGITCEF